MTALGLILARGGSKGLVDKHQRPLLGRPVLDYTFAHTRASQRLTHVALTSDCPRLRAMAASCGIETIERPPHLATDTASVQDTLLDGLDVIERRLRTTFDAIVCLYGNVPVRPDGVIDAALDLLEQSRCDSVRSFCPVGKWHPRWMSRLDAAGVVDPLHAGSIHRRQDLEPVWLHDGAVVAVTRGSLRRGLEHPDDPHAFFGVDRRGINVGSGETVEIDEPRDLYWAEAVLRDRETRASERKAS